MNRLIPILICLLASACLPLGGCSLFSTPGRVTSAEGTSEVGGVYMHVVQPASGIGCPSAIAFGAQTMGSIQATCTDSGRTQTINAQAPDPNPALTTAYAGINSELSSITALVQTLVGAAISSASPVPVPGAQLAPPRRTFKVAPNQLCPPGTVPVTIAGQSITCQ